MISILRPHGRVRCWGSTGKSLASVGQQQQRVVSLEQIHAQVLHHVRHARIHRQGQFDLGLNKIQSDEQPLLGLDQWGVFANALGQFPKNAHNFSALIVAQHLQFVVDLMAVRGFNKGDRPVLEVPSADPRTFLLWVLATARTRRSFK